MAYHVGGMPRSKPSSEPMPAPDLKDACVEAAREAIAAHGIEHLSLRDVARRLGVSHQAPYRHYPSRDHLLAEVMRRCFEHFSRHLDARARSDDPRAELESLGRQYLSFALTHPLEYRLMFGTPWPEAAAHPDLQREANHAFDILRRALSRIHGVALPSARVDEDAMFIWSTMHGLAGIMGGSCMPDLSVDGPPEIVIPPHVLAMIGLAMEGRFMAHSAPVNSPPAG